MSARSYSSSAVKGKWGLRWGHNSCKKAFRNARAPARMGQSLDPGCLRIAPASRRDEISVCATKPVQRISVVSTTFREFTLAVSARLMPVTHRPLLARAPKPVRSPESRWPQGLEILVSGSYRSGSSARASHVSDGRLRSSPGLRQQVAAIAISIDPASTPQSSSNRLRQPRRHYLGASR